MDKPELKKIGPIPGDYILQAVAKGEIEQNMQPDGAYYHYSEVVRLIKPLQSRISELEEKQDCDKRTILNLRQEQGELHYKIQELEKENLRLKDEVAGYENTQHEGLSLPDVGETVPEPGSNLGTAEGYCPILSKPN